MTGRMSREKGYRAEAAAVAWLRLNGFPHCQRQSSGAAGADIADLGPGLELEVKNRAKWDLGAWLDQLAAVMDRNDADMGAVIVKRTGTTDVGQWWFCQTRSLSFDLIGSAWGVRQRNRDPVGSVGVAVVDPGRFSAPVLAAHWVGAVEWCADLLAEAVPLLHYERPEREQTDHYSITTVEHGVRLLRAAGYGTPLPTEATP